MTIPCQLCQRSTWDLKKTSVWCKLLIQHSDINVFIGKAVGRKEFLWLCIGGAVQWLKSVEHSRLVKIPRECKRNVHLSLSWRAVEKCRNLQRATSSGETFGCYLWFGRRWCDRVGGPLRPGSPDSCWYVVSLANRWRMEWMKRMKRTRMLS